LIVQEIGYAWFSREGARGFFMTRLDDFLRPLHEGVWEVVVDKGSVTEPLDTGWKRSTINVPSPDMIASYRKGTYHVHETPTEWRVHLDRYDPDIHPILHLVDDAPLLLMIASTFGTLIMSVRKTPDDDIRQVMEQQTLSWQRQCLLGLVFLFAGALIITNPLDFFSGITHYVVPPLLICLGLAILWNGLDARLPGVVYGEGAFQGACIFCAGLVSWFLPTPVWGLVILCVLSLWAFASAFLLISLVAKHRSTLPEEFVNRLGLGILCLVFALLLLMMPVVAVLVLMIILGCIALLLGLVLIVNGLRLRRWMMV
jgi:uncharacterized membrane protein HdeD (DUF308 family)